MDTKLKEKRILLNAAAIALGIGVLSAFASIFIYEDPSGRIDPYNLPGLIEGNSFTYNVLAYYGGKVYWQIDSIWVSVFATISIVSLVCSIIGLVTLRQQMPNKKQFRLTIVGLIGTCLPALLVLIAVPVFGPGFPGKLSYGAYPVVAPLATLVSVLAVYRGKNKAQEEMEKRGKIWKAGADDLK